MCLAGNRRDRTAYRCLSGCRVLDRRIWRAALVGSVVMSMGKDSEVGSALAVPHQPAREDLPHSRRTVVECWGCSDRCRAPEQPHVWLRKTRGDPRDWMVSGIWILLPLPNGYRRSSGQESRAVEHPRGSFHRGYPSDLRRRLALTVPPSLQKQMEAERCFARLAVEPRWNG